MDPTITEGSNPVIQAPHLFGHQRDVAKVRELYELCVGQRRDPSATTETASSSNAARLVLIQGPRGVGKRAVAKKLKPLVESDNGLYVSASFRPRATNAKGFENYQHSALFQAIGNLERVVDETLLRRIQDLMQQENFATRADRALLSEMLSESHLQSSDVADTDVRPRQHAGDTISNASSNESVTSIPPVCCGLSTPHDECSLLAGFLGAVSTLVPVVLQLDQAQNAHDNELQALTYLLEPSTELLLLTKGLVIILCQDSDDEDQVGSGRESASVESRLSHFNLHPHTKLQLANLSWDDVYLWVREWHTERINGAEEMIHETTDLVYESTLGNPQHIHYLFVYMELGGLEISPKGAPSLVDAENVACKDVGRLFQRIINLQGRLLQRIIETVAAIGEACYGMGGVTCELVEMVLQQPCHDALMAAEKHRLLESCGGRYTFVSPRFQRMAYALISEVNRPQVHLCIGRRIWKNSASSADCSEQGLLTLVATQLQLGMACVTHSEERRMIANIHWEAGKRAMKLATFSEAASHFNSSISVLHDEAWSGDLYNMSLGLHNCAAEAYYCAGDFDQMDRVLNAVFANASSLEDKLQAYTTLVFANGARHRLHEVISITLSVLNQLGVSIPPNPSNAAVFAELVRTRRRLRTKNSRSLCNLPLASDSKMISAMTLLSLTMLYSYALQPKCGAMAVFHCIRLTVLHGITAPSATAFCAYGSILARGLGETTEGYHFGQLSLTMLDEVASGAWLSRVYYMFYGLISFWVRPFRESVEPLLYAQRSALKSGDFEGGLTCASLYLTMAFNSGKHVSTLQQEILHFCRLMESLGQTTGLLLIVPFWNVLCDLTGRPPSDLSLSCNMNDRAAAMNVAQGEGNQMVKSHGDISETICGALMGDYSKSVAAAVRAQKVKKDAEFKLGFYGGLSMLALARDSGGWQRRRLMAKGRRFVQRLGQWAKTCPANFGNKHALLEAEWEALHGRTQKALPLFDKSIKLAKLQGFVQDEGLAYERLARYHCFLGNSAVATPYYVCARDAYSQWGAQTLVDRLDKLKPG
jgi:AAA ATPase domain